MTIGDITLKTTFSGLHFLLQKVAMYRQPLLRNLLRKLSNSVKLRNH